MHRYPREFRAEDVPVYACPACGHMSVVPTRPAELHRAEHHVRSRAHEDWEPAWETREFVIRSCCSIARCAQTVYIVGDETESEDYDDDGSPYRYTALISRAIHPAPPIIVMPADTPNPVRMAVNNSFKLAWVNEGATANTLRIAVEHILDDLGIPRERGRSEKGRKRIDLFDRIQLYANDSDFNQAPILEAMRMIGNTGSHGAYVSWSTLMDAFQILEHALSKLYGDSERLIEQARERIAKKYGP